MANIVMPAHIVQTLTIPKENGVINCVELCVEERTQEQRKVMEIFCLRSVIPLEWTHSNSSCYRTCHL